MYVRGDFVQIVNHSEPSCNLHYGTILEATVAYNKDVYYTVQLAESDSVCSCTSDELMEG